MCIIIILDLALAAPRVLPVGPSAHKSLSRIGIPSGLYNYIFQCLLDLLYYILVLYVL